MVSISRDKITWPGARIRKKGEGMPNYENNNLQGTLYVTFDVEFPKQELSDDDKEGIELTSTTISINKYLNFLQQLRKSLIKVQITRSTMVLEVFEIR